MKTQQDYEMDRLALELKHKADMRRRKYDRQPADNRQTNMVERAMANILVLREALKNPDLSAGGRAIMLRSLKQNVRIAEGKPPTIGASETMTCIREGGR